MSAGKATGEPQGWRRTRIVKGVEPGHMVMLFPCEVDRDEVRLISSVRNGSATVAMKPPALREYAGHLLALAMAVEADAVERAAAKAEADAATTAPEGGE
jgi:hypothetical protein